MFAINMSSRSNEEYADFPPTSAKNKLKSLWNWQHLKLYVALTVTNNIEIHQ